jgi:hypothetical protein
MSAVGAPQMRLRAGQDRRSTPFITPPDEIGRVEGVWDELDVVLQTFITGRRHFITHGICPRCFDQRAPGTRYPET